MVELKGDCKKSNKSTKSPVFYECKLYLPGKKPKKYERVEIFVISD